MFGRTVDPNEREDVLGFLGRWNQAIARIDQATNTMRFTMAQHPLGMRSGEFEEARQAAIEVLREVQAETSGPRFWPILADNKGAKLMLEFREKLDESHAHQLNLLNLYGIAAAAFRGGRDDQAPSPEEIAASNTSFARVLDEMGKTGGRLARRYNISGQEIQKIMRHLPPTSL